MLKQVFFLWNSGVAGDGYGSCRTHAFSTREKAEATLRSMGGDAAYYSIKEETAYIDERGVAFSVKDLGMTLDESADDRARRNALSKLTDDEKRALGLSMDEKSQSRETGGLCGFDEAWIGLCKVPAKLCTKHQNKRCRCGGKAIRSCDATIGAFVCGTYLCGQCRCH